jgi:hypothetical protein
VIIKEALEAGVPGMKDVFYLFMKGKKSILFRIKVIES